MRRGVLPDPDVRSVRFVTDLDGDTLTYTADGRYLTDLSTCDPVIVGYEYGWDAPPGDLLEKFARTVRLALNASSSPIDGRAMSFTSPTGETQRFPTPGLGPWIYGIPDVDQVIMRHRVNVPGFA